MGEQKSAVYQGVEELSEEECLAIARLKLKSSDVTVDHVAMRPLSDAPAGFLGDHYKVRMTVRTCSRGAKSGDASDLYFFVKTKPRIPSRVEFGESLGVFKRERDFFATLKTLWRAGGEDASVDAWSPACYLANERLVVLDDLAHQGFRLAQGRRGLDFQHCAVLLRTLASFHAASVVFEEREGRRLDHMFPGMLEECVWTKEPGGAGRRNCEAGVHAAVSLVRRMARSCRRPERYDGVLMALGTLFDEGCRMVATSSEHRNVVCHSDLWANNFMFRYDSEGVPCDGRLIDYQILRYAPPASDVMSALYLNTRRETREKHFPALAKVYHDELSTQLAAHGLDVERLVPWTAFRASLEQYRWLGILICFVYYPTTLMTERLALEVIADPEMFRKFMLEDQSDVALRCFEDDLLYRERFGESVEELADYLDEKCKATTRC